MTTMLEELARLLAQAADPGEWQDSALCAQTDPEAFYPEKGESTRPAKQICGGCSVRSECLEWALDRGERFGVWGGLSERQRRLLARPARHRFLKGDRDDEVLRLHAQDWELEAIASAVGVSTRTVRRIVEAARKRAALADVQLEASA